MNSQVKNADLSSLKINRDINYGSSSKKKYYIIGGILLILVALIFLKDNTVPVKTISVVSSSVSSQNSILTGQGYVVAQVKAAISSKATGRLEALYVIEGDKVQAGDIIGRIESKDVEAFLSQQKAQLEVIKASLANAQAEFDDANAEYIRQQSLFQSGAGTQSELDAVTARWKRAQAQIRSAQAQSKAQEAAIKAAQVQVENTIIRAPFTGTVLSKNANVGEVITALGAAAGSRGAVVTLADMSSLEVEADVSESSLSKISQNQPVEISVSAISDKKYKGYVSKIIPTADRGKGTVQIKIRFTDVDERVLPEMGAKVNFFKPTTDNKEIQEQPKILIPKSAIIEKNGKKIVFTVGAESTASEQEITVGESLGDYYEVKKGISSGATLVISNVQKLKQGSSITIEE